MNPCSFLRELQAVLTDQLKHAMLVIFHAIEAGETDGVSIGTRRYPFSAGTTPAI